MYDDDEMDDEMDEEREMADEVLYSHEFGGKGIFIPGGPNQERKFREYAESQGHPEWLNGYWEGSFDTYYCMRFAGWPDGLYSNDERCIWLRMPDDPSDGELYEPLTPWMKERSDVIVFDLVYDLCQADTHERVAEALKRLEAESDDVQKAVRRVVDVSSLPRKRRR